MLIPFQIAISAFIFSQVLTSAGKPFHFLTKLSLPKYLKSPLYYCSICVCGQWSLWLGIFYYHIHHPVELILFILQAMFFVWIIEKLRTKF